MGVVIAIVVVAALVLLLGFWFIRKSRSRRELKQRFGPEYDRTIEYRGKPRQRREAARRTRKACCGLRTEGTRATRSAALRR